MAKANVPAWTLTIVGLVLLIAGAIWYFTKSSSTTKKGTLGPIILISIGFIFLLIGIVLFFKPKHGLPEEKED